MPHKAKKTAIFTPRFEDVFKNFVAYAALKRITAQTKV